MCSFLKIDLIYDKYDNYTLKLEFKFTLCRQTRQRNVIQKIGALII